MNQCRHAPPKEKGRKQREMASKKLQPSPALLFQIGATFRAYGYKALTMEKLAEACNFTRRALYFYFSSKAEAFRAYTLFRNEVALSTSFEAGRKRWSDGGNALEILSDVINIRYGDTRRLANASKHVVELNAEVFTRCNDIVRDVALIFEADLTKLIIELQRAGLLHLRPDVTAEQFRKRLPTARAASTSASQRSHRQSWPTAIAKCVVSSFYGCAEIPAAGGPKPRKKTKLKTERRRN